MSIIMKERFKKEFRKNNIEQIRKYNKLKECK